MLKSTVILGAIILVVQAQLDMDSDKMNFEDNIAQESQSDEQRIFANAITAKPLLNDGK
ncbi:CLUMA_CG001717, isoform A, partial [Clunio marinus]